MLFGTVLAFSSGFANPLDVDWKLVFYIEVHSLEISFTFSSLIKMLLFLLKYKRIEHPVSSV